mgnify:CR=1 FL=1
MDVVVLVLRCDEHVLRGWRWKQTLEPLDAHPKTSDCVDAIFVSYATNLVLPRVGEVSRCGVLAKYDNVSFAKSLGTVVTERLVDTLCILLITGITFLVQMPVFCFLIGDGDQDSITDASCDFSLVLCGSFFLLLVFWYFSIFCCVCSLFFEKVKGVVLNIWEGVMSLKNVKNVPLFVLYTLLIWLCYFYHFYITFYCFQFYRAP